jgi:homoserine dehydrogenase
MREARVAFIGFGNVNQAFVELFLNKLKVINSLDVEIKFVGVATKRHGIAINQAGFDLQQLLEASYKKQSLEKFHTQKRIRDTLEFIQKVEAEVLIECSLLNPETGQPAINYVRAALQRGMHIITANKSAPAFAYQELMALAKAQEQAFLFEGAVLDGLPIFSLAQRTLPGTEIVGFRGILNSTTNFILTAMEEGLSLEDALRQAQALGISEKDPDYDLDGWDAAAKTAILVNALLGGNITPHEVARTGIRQLTTRTVIEAARQGRRFKLLAEGQWREGELTARVNPRMLALNDPLAHVAGSSAALTLITDTLGEITIHLNNGEVPQTAYALFSDLVTVIQRYYAP